MTAIETHEWNGVAAGYASSPEAFRYQQSRTKANITYLGTTCKEMADHVRAVIKQATALGDGQISPHPFVYNPSRSLDQSTLKTYTVTAEKLTPRAAPKKPWQKTAAIVASIALLVFFFASSALFGPVYGAMGTVLAIVDFISLFASLALLGYGATPTEEEKRAKMEKTLYARLNRISPGVYGENKILVTIAEGEYEPCPKDVYDKKMQRVPGCMPEPDLLDEDIMSKRSFRKGPNMPEENRAKPRKFTIFNMRTHGHLTLYEREIDYIEKLGICGPRQFPIPTTYLDPSLAIEKPVNRNYSGTCTKGSPDNIIKL